MDRQNLTSTSISAMLKKARREAHEDSESLLVYAAKKNNVVDSKRARGFQSNSKLEPSEIEEEIMFSWDSHKRELRHIFFRNFAMIQRESEIEDFFKFANKYHGMKKQSLLKKMVDHQQQEITLDQSSSSKTAHGKLNLPKNYSKEHCLNFRLNLEDSDELHNKFASSGYEPRKDRLSLEKISEFKLIITLYLDFLQKQRFEKLRKLREDQNKLPIYEYKDEIVETLQKHNIVIIAGDTGCGKSTQVPQYLLKAGYRHIACTQPRRIACISLSKRVAFETLNEYGSKIGYQIRFEKRKTEHTRVVFLTEGLLLKQVCSDPLLSNYDVVILDEIHERHLQTDFLLGVMKCLLLQRKDVKVILMSATINIELFKTYFMGTAPVIQVPGRLYPIDLKFFPISSEDRCDKRDKINPQPYIRVLQMIDNKYSSEERGDVLIFLSGVSEITTICDAVRQYAQQNSKWVVLPLHSTLSVTDQERVFDIVPEGRRKCIVSTNIAETSITIDGIRFVVDSGKVKEMSYDSIAKLQRLKEFWVSQASAEQRKGRAGRTGPGVCYRLYSEKEYASFTPYTIPEIRRVPLDSLILQMMYMGLPDIKLFPFIEPPDDAALDESIASLKQQSALTADCKLTQIGVLLAQLPMDITLGKMLIIGSLFNQVGPVLTLAAAMSVQSPFTNRAYRDLESSTLNEEFESNHGDPFTLVAAYREWLAIKVAREDSRRWCRKRCLEEQRFYEITKLRQQFSQMLDQCGLKKLPERMSESAAERAKRYGEISQLKSMKRQLHSQSSRKSKVLKIDHDGLVDSDDEQNPSAELKDIDFKIRYDGKTLDTMRKSSKIESYKDMILIKLIICSGLFPNVALADEHNNYKQGSDQIFHTKSKPFVVLHPSGVFSRSPDILQLNESDIVELPGFNSRFPCSSHHQLLVFVSLLETTKTYICNTFRVPSLQTLLLFSNEIDTNADLSTLVFDQFIEVKVAQPTVSQDMVFEAVNLRFKWSELLRLRIAASKPTIERHETLIIEALKLEKEVSSGLINFFLREPLYSIKRLVAADIKVLFAGPEPGLSAYNTNPFAKLQPKESYSDGEPSIGDSILRTNTVKGGFVMTDFLTFNSILELDDVVRLMGSFNSICPYCDDEIDMNTLERFHHMADCLNKSGKRIPKQEASLEQEGGSNKEYYCKVCEKTYRLSILEIIKHKKSHL